MQQHVRRIRSIVAGLLGALLFALVAPTAFAQSGLGSVTGTIHDETGGSLSGATVRLVEESTGAARSAVSNEAGLFNVPAVPPGVYTISIERQDFQTKVIEHVTVNSFQQLSLGQVTLAIAVGATDAIEIVAARPQLDLDSGVRFETIQARQVQDMPIQGRNWSTLLKVIPGSNPTNANAIVGREYSASGYADFSINGKNPQQTQVNLDGGSLVDHGSDAKLTVAPSLESIHEVSVLTNNFQAEYGNRGGTVVNIVTKSGTNQFKGAVFDYLRNEALNANTWLNNFQNLEKTKYRFNYFGGNLGGPIQRNRLFFFYNFENFKQELPAGLLRGRVPTEAERNGDFSQTIFADGTRPTIFMPGTQGSGNPVQIANRIIPQELIHPLGRALMNVYPLPNNPGDPSNNYVQPYPRSQPRHSHTVKVDWNLSDKTQAYARYTADGGTQRDRNQGSSGGVLPGGLIARPRPDYALAANATHTFTPTFVMNSLFAWSYDAVDWVPTDPDGISRSKFGLAGLPAVFPVTDDVLPEINVPGTGGFGSYQFNRIPAYARAHEYQVASTFTWARSSHIVKYGFQWIRNLKDEIDASNNKGVYNFSPATGSPFDTAYAPANLLVGAISSFQQIERVNRKNSRYNDIHAFVQDTWKARNTLTLDYGVRFYHIPTEHNRYPDDTLDAVFLPSRWDPAKAPRFYVPDPKSPSRIIDPAFPDQPVAANLSNVLRYTIVPGTGDLMNGVVPLGKDGEIKAGIQNPKWLLFAPRGGFAWTPFGSQRALLRGGFGWAYNRNNIADTVNRYENGLARTANLSQTSFATMSSAAVQPITARNIGGRDETQRNVPTVYDYSVSFQYQLFSDMVVDVAYIGNTQTNQPVTFNLNAIVPGTMFKPEFVAANQAGFNFLGPISASNPGPALPGSNTMDPVVMRPFRGFNTINMTSNIARVEYNSLQVSASKRLSHGLALDVYYTLAQSKTEAQNAGPYNFNWRDYSGFKWDDHRAHIFTVNYSYEVPNVSKRLHFDNPIGRILLDDWKVAHLFSAFSGQDYSPSFNVQFAGSTSNVDLRRVFLGTPDFDPRLQAAGDPNSLNRDIAHQFDPSQLAIPGIFPTGTGTGPRNFLRGRPSFSNDISFMKSFRIHDKQRLEIRANVFNPFNSFRQTAVNGGLLYKANGRTFQDGFTLFNTPEANLARAQANGVTDPTVLYNTFRSGVGHVNLTNTDTIGPPRIIEIGMAFRF